MCPYCITVNAVNNHSESNKICDYKCNVCIENSSRASAFDINVYTNLDNPHTSDNVTVCAESQADDAAAAAAAGRRRCGHLRK